MTLLTEKGIATVAGTVRPDFASVGEMADVLFLCVIRPGRILLVWREGCTHGVNAANEFSIFAEHIEHSAAHARHDVHVGDDVGGVRNLDSDLRDRRTDGSHAIGDDK